MAIICYNNQNRNLREIITFKTDSSILNSRLWSLFKKLFGVKNQVIKWKLKREGGDDDKECDDDDKEGDKIAFFHLGNLFGFEVIPGINCRLDRDRLSFNFTASKVILRS